ncbi:hypothetical protein Tco_1049696, partial [Tanacetum coccineum]
SPNYVSGPEYLKYVAPSDDEMLVEDQPLPIDASPTALSLGYVVDSDLKEDPEENPEEAFEEASEEDEDEEEEHLALADYAAATPSPPPRSPRTKVPFSQICLPASPSTHHLLLSLDIPPPPFLVPYTAHRDDIPEADMPLQKRARFFAPASRFKVGESLTAATARQTGHTLARRVDYRFFDTVDASIRAFESRVMTFVEEVNKRVTDLTTTQRQDAHEI